MRLAYVSADPGVPIFGTKGCSIHVQEMIGAMAAQGVQLDLISPRMEGELPSHWRHVRLHRLNEVAKGDAATRERSCLALNDQLKFVLNSLSRIDGVYERYSLWSHAACDWAGERRRSYLLEVNAPLIDEQVNHRSLVNIVKARQIEEQLFSDATCVLPVSDGVASYVRRIASRACVSVIGNGADPDRFTPKPPESSSALVTIGFVGTMKPWHGVELLLDAYAAVHSRWPNTRLLLVGDGTELDRLKSRAEALGIAANCVFTGAISPQQIPELVRKMDIAVAPYPQSDSFYFCPLKVLEYMSSGCAVVASDIGVLRDWIVDGFSGRLVPGGDVAALADCLCELVNEPARRTKMGAAAREAVLRQHTWGHVVRRVLSLFEEFREPAPLGSFR